MALGLEIYPGKAVCLRDIPELAFEDFHNNIAAQYQKGGRSAAFWGCRAGDEVRLFIIFAYDQQSRLEITTTKVKDNFPSLTPEFPQLHYFEREISEQWAVYPQGHPWLKPIRYHKPYVWAAPVKDEKIHSLVTDFFRIDGKAIHEVAVGPVHAGIIEPGHFRFQCHGEQVFHLEISLGYQHRGVEQALIAGPDKRSIHYAETLAGDTSIGHALAYCQAIESLSGCDAPPLRAQAIRGIMLELERLANHTGDLGALASDVGYLPTSSYCGRLRGDFLNMTALICGNRFGRNMLIPGGVNFDLDEALIHELEKRLNNIFKDVKNAVNLLWDSPSVMERFEGTGIISSQTAKELGLVGLVGRACGIERDVRFDFPSGIFCFSQIPVSSYSSGDVFGRAFVRWLEIQRSTEFIHEQLRNLPEGEISKTTGPLLPEALTVSFSEGWRGEICHVLITDNTGKIAQYKIKDPSFNNWMGLAMALRNEEISNFPLCNKSFNLSYCGHDL